MIVVETERLTRRHASSEDADFVLRLLNEPSFLRYIGDRGVRTLDDARRYIADRLIDSYERNGFGLWVVERNMAVPLGICGLVKRHAARAGHRLRFFRSSGRRAMPTNRR